MFIRVKLGHGSPREPVHRDVAADSGGIGAIRRPGCGEFGGGERRLEGLADLVGTMRRVRGALNPALDLEGVLLTMYDDRTNLGQLVARDVREFFKDKVFNTIIPRNVRLGEAPSHGVPAVLYDVKSRGAAAYVALAKEMLARRAA